MKIIEHADMSEYTSFRTGGPADRLIICEDEEELASLLKELSAEHAEHLILGNGTNVLVRDGGYHGTVIRPGAGFETITADPESGRITAGSACLLSQVAKKAMEESLSGFEFASGIPGSVGGAVFMNAGAYGGEMKEIVESVRLMAPDGSRTYDVPVSELDLGYRTSRIQTSGEIVTQVTFCLKKGIREEIVDLMKELKERRNAKQPLMYPSCGSFFKRPEGHFAGQLIENAGLKGLSVGGAQVSEKHAGFIVNRGGATAEDIIRLMRLVQNTVMDQFGVQLEPEVRIVGDEF